MNLKQLYLGRCIPVEVALIALEAKEPWWQGAIPRGSLVKDASLCRSCNPKAAPTGPVLLRLDEP